MGASLRAEVRQVTIAGLDRLTYSPLVQYNQQLAVAASCVSD